MSLFHQDPVIDHAFDELLRELNSWERATGRESLLVFIPIEKDEKVIVADSGIRFL